VQGFGIEACPQSCPTAQSIATPVQRAPRSSSSSLTARLPPRSRRFTVDHRNVNMSTTAHEGV
jgi:hypothetical protein